MEIRNSSFVGQRLTNDRGGVIFLTQQHTDLWSYSTAAFAGTKPGVAELCLLIVKTEFSV